MPTIERCAAIDPIIQGLAGRLRSIKATDEELVYAVTEVLKGVLKPSVNWTMANATRYLSVTRHIDYESQNDVLQFKMAPELPPGCPSSYRHYVPHDDLKCLDSYKPLSGPATTDVVVKPGGEVFNFCPAELAVEPCCQDVKFEIKDAERSGLFDEMVEKYLPRCGCCTDGCSKKGNP